MKGSWFNFFSAVPSGRNLTQTIYQPLRSWLISGCRFATQFILTAVLLLKAIDARAQTTNSLSDAEIQGQALAQKILQQWPAENVTNAGVLQIRDKDGKRSTLPLKVEVTVTETNWSSRYEAMPGSNSTDVTSLIVTHSLIGPNQYLAFENGKETSAGPGNRTMIPFAGSEFYLGDLGLEFFHWPGQKVLRREVHRSCGCTVLESTNPEPAADAYSKVVAWIDNDSLGIVEAYAYDAKGKRWKDFEPKDLKKIHGQYQVQTMFMENVQTGARTRMEFNLKK